MRFKKALKWAGVGFVGFIVLAIIIAIFGSENPGDDEAPPSFSELADTPAPTNTIVSPSSDKPAAVPAPTMTPERATINPTENAGGGPDVHSGTDTHSNHEAPDSDSYPAGIRNRWCCSAGSV